MPADPKLPETTAPAPAVQADHAGGQDRAAAERSAHVERRAEAPVYRDACFGCGGPWRRGGASYAARAGAALGVPRAVVEVCSAECAVGLGQRVVGTIGLT